jgi:integrase
VLAYHKAHADTWKNRKTAHQFLSRLQAYVFPKLADVRLEEINTALINDTLAPIWNRIPDTAARVKAQVARILQWVKDGRPLPKPKSNNGKLHHPALPFSQLPEFLADLRTHQGIAARALEFTILTCVRTSESTGARWSELDLEQRIWEIPAPRMKSTRPHRVPLSAVALTLLEALPREEDNPHEFIGLQAGAPLSNAAMLQILRNTNDARERQGLPRYTDPKQGGRDITVHGFRSTFRDWTGEATSFDNQLAEAALHHKLRSGTEAAYARGDLFDKRRKLMEAWAKFCTQPRPRRVTRWWCHCGQGREHD